MGLVRTLIEANIRLSQAFDSILPERVREDGNRHFTDHIVPLALRRGITLYDVGSGRTPCLSRETKEKWEMTVVGLDISAEELAAAPPGAYDRAIVADIGEFVGAAEADAVICRALLEHVPDTSRAMRALAGLLKDGGRMFIFVPSRNAVFARLNLLLDENLKKSLLRFFYPEAKGQGFRAYYSHCTPSQIEELAKKNRLEVEVRRLFWISSYFQVFIPAFLLWRLGQLLLFQWLRTDAAETFIYVLRKD
ncbi:class I SAM-dependent methyltransferase [Methylocapsa acidiphila]|uniref:class I SAM-dependent methyltransferase n=1 Tax=Methylocapsa acidiphila TaxID=133552 RepID=UPI00047AE089|nr:methyltransferase domain-containing protein [Methylocapsa acidiphila]